MNRKTLRRLLVVLLVVVILVIGLLFFTGKSFSRHTSQPTNFRGIGIVSTSPGFLVTLRGVPGERPIPAPESV